MLLRLGQDSLPSVAISLNRLGALSDGRPCTHHSPYDDLVLQIVRLLMYWQPKTGSFVTIVTRMRRRAVRASSVSRWRRPPNRPLFAGTPSAGVIGMSSNLDRHA